MSFVGKRTRGKTSPAQRKSMDRNEKRGMRLVNKRRSEPKNLKRSQKNLKPGARPRRTYLRSPPGKEQSPGKDSSQIGPSPGHPKRAKDDRSLQNNMHYNEEEMEDKVEEERTDYGMKFRKLMRESQEYAQPPMPAPTSPEKQIDPVDNIDIEKTFRNGMVNAGDDEQDEMVNAGDDEQDEMVNDGDDEQDEEGFGNHAEDDKHLPHDAPRETVDERSSSVAVSSLTHGDESLNLASLPNKMDQSDLVKLVKKLSQQNVKLRKLVNADKEEVAYNPLVEATIRAVVKEHLFPKVQFIRHDDLFYDVKNKKSIGNFVMNQCQIVNDLDVRAQFWDTYKQVVRKQIKVSRNVTHNALKKKFFGEFITVQTQPTSITFFDLVSQNLYFMPYFISAIIRERCLKTSFDKSNLMTYGLPKMEELHKLRSGFIYEESLYSIRNRGPLLFFKVFLPCVGSIKEFGKKISHQYLSDMFTVSQEGYILLELTNNYEVWKLSAMKKYGHPDDLERDEPEMFGKDHEKGSSYEGDDASTVRRGGRGTKWTHSRYYTTMDGWSEDGMKNYNNFCSTVARDRKSENGLLFEEKFLQQMRDDKKIGSFRSPQDALFVQPYNDLWGENNNDDNENKDDDEDSRFDDGGDGRFHDEISMNNKKGKTDEGGCLTINPVTSDLTYDHGNDDDDTEADGSDDDEN